MNKAKTGTDMTPDPNVMSLEEWKTGFYHWHQVLSPMSQDANPVEWKIIALQIWQAWGPRAKCTFLTGLRVVMSLGVSSLNCPTSLAQVSPQQQE